MKKAAPGKSFRKGMTAVDIMRLFPDNETAEQWIISRRWPNGIICPRCDSDNVPAKAKHLTMPHRCRSCRKFFSEKTGSATATGKVSYQDWAQAIYILKTSLKCISSMKLHRELGTTQTTAWHLAMRIRETWNDKQAQFSKRVEVDATYMGGKERTKHEHEELNAGRRTFGKTATVGAKDRETNQITATPVADTTGQTFKGFVKATTDSYAIVYTDDHGSNQGLPNHESVAHSAGEYVRGLAHTNGVESFWSMLKRGCVGTNHQLSNKRLHRYVNKFSGRHNNGPADTIDKMGTIDGGMVGKSITYKHLTA